MTIVEALGVIILVVMVTYILIVMADVIVNKYHDWMRLVWMDG